MNPDDIEETAKNLYNDKHGEELRDMSQLRFMLAIKKQSDKQIGFITNLDEDYMEKKRSPIWELSVTTKKVFS